MRYERLSSVQQNIQYLHSFSNSFMHSFIHSLISVSLLQQKLSHLLEVSSHYTGISKSPWEWCTKNIAGTHKSDTMLRCSVHAVLYSLFTMQYQWQLQSKRERTAAPIIRFTTRKLHWPKSALVRRNPQEYPPLASSETWYCPVYRWHFDFQICPLVIKWHVKDSEARAAVVGRDHCSRKEGEFTSVLKLQLSNKY